MRSYCSLLAVLFSVITARAQNYTAVNGSSYMGSLSVHQNPASIVNSPLKWDLTLFGFQDKHTTNAVKVYNYSLLSNPANSQYSITPGDFSRYAQLNFNLNLLNARIALNRRSSIAFGANLRSYVTLSSSRYNFIDTLNRFADFFSLNPGAKDLKLGFASSSWAELYASYAQTIMDNEVGRLNAGLTLKVNRGLSGGFVDLANGNFTRNGTTDPVGFMVDQADIDIGYSANYDGLDSAGTGSKAANFLKSTDGGGSVDLGVEYIVKLPGISNAMDEDDGYFDYDWKIGLALLDIGFGQYKFGKYSTSVRNLRPGITDGRLDQAFDTSINSAQALHDSLAGLYSSVGNYTGKFRINHPARLVLNIDKFIAAAFYINADISIGFTGVGGGDNKAVRDLNLLTVTPRWETRKAGYYLPVYYNNRHQLWVGGAVRLGPVLLGVHNWSNLFSKKKIERGGAYLAVIFKASNITRSKGDKRLDCPPAKL